MTVTPIASPAGTAIDEFRSLPSQSIGADHFLLVFGPVGALKSPRAFWPQLPSNASQASAASGPLGSRDHPHLGHDALRRPGRVVAAEPLAGAAPEPELG